MNDNGNDLKAIQCEIEKMKELIETRFIPRAVSISIPQQVKTIKINEEIIVNAEIEPKNSIQALKWSVSNNSIQINNSSVTPAGIISGSQVVLKGIHGGETTLTATTIDGSNIQSSINLSVFQAVTSITIEPSISHISLNEEVKIRANVEPKDALNRNVIFKITGNGVQMKDTSGKVANEIKSHEVVLLGIGEGVSTLTVTAEDGSNTQFKTSITALKNNTLSYANGARVTYVSSSSYNCSSGFYVAKNSGYTGSNSPVNSNLVHSQDNFWGALNGWNTQGSLENDDNKSNIDLTHEKVKKNNSSSTTIYASNQNDPMTIIINPRAYYGDISKCIFKMSECYLASANSDGNVGKFKIYVSTSNDESVATNPNDSSWSFVTEGSLSTDTSLIKVYNGNVNFKYIKLSLYTRGKSYMELAAIKVF